MPQTAPIVEQPMQQQNDNLFSFNPMVESVPTPQPVAPAATESIQPIIVTDYNKQYDPVMPESYNQPQEKADFKEVINAIRECQSKIEEYGYKIDMEEYDLTNLYQVIIKIEK